ncbi:MAG: C4-type zinc ribbon domain-containing protein [Bacteroidota bacterium]|nr:C4-type zinc ribbon domain-containing protein [Bacteroidota bacterium]
MEDTIRLLYLLQKVDSNLDEVEESKGDLPETVQTLEIEVAELTEKVKGRQEYIEGQVAARNKADEDIKDFEEKLKKYKAQQYQVRNNKEYDAITKEIDFAEESVKTLTKQFEDFENQMSMAKKEAEELQTKLDEQGQILEEKKAELAEVSKETEEEELKYKHEREKLIVRMNKDNLAKYNKIRSARGKAVVPVRKNSCSGCGNRIPPQHIIELRRNDKIYICQHCGRIVVSDELARNVNAQ